VRFARSPQQDGEATAGTSRKVVTGAPRARPASDNQKRDIAMHARFRLLLLFAAPFALSPFTGQANADALHLLCGGSYGERTVDVDFGRQTACMEMLNPQINPPLCQRASIGPRYVRWNYPNVITLDLTAARITWADGTVAGCRKTEPLR